MICKKEYNWIYLLQDTKDKTGFRNKTTQLLCDISQWENPLAAVQHHLYANIKLSVNVGSP